MAGLRPYRASGFVVRRDQLGDKALVHNYGHGGAGITLSWGSSRLATNLGLQGHSGPVAIVGAGVMGLTTARLVQEAGFPVTIYTAVLPPETTSNVAGGQISPFGHFSEDAVTPEWRAQFAAAMAYSWSRFQIMAGDRVRHSMATDLRGKPAHASRRRPRASCPTGASCRRPIIRSLWRTSSAIGRCTSRPARFLRQLTADVLSAEGKIQLRKFAIAGRSSHLAGKLIFNCTGIGARDLFGDVDLHPVRGQLAVLLPQPEVLYAAAGRWGYMFPRPTASCSVARSSATCGTRRPIRRTSIGIVSSHRRFFDSFRCTA